MVRSDCYMRGRALRSMAEVEDQIVAEMAALDGSIQRYQYLVQQGRELPAPTVKIRTEEFAVPGCQSQVWIRKTVVDGCVRIEADSDAAITRGMIALLVRVLDGQPEEVVRGAELGFLDLAGLRAQLSPSRANGLAAMVEVVVG